MSGRLSLLLVEDNPDDAFLLLRQIRGEGYEVDATQIQTADALKNALRDKTWDCILCDYSMPKFNALEALQVVKESQLDIPFIIVSGVIGEETAVSGHEGRRS